MHRPWRARVGASLFAIWLALVLVEPAAIHTCAVHDGVASSQQAPHAPTSGHAAHTPGRSDGGSAPAHGDHGHRCTCLGQCCDAAVVALVTHRIDLPPLPTASGRPLPPVDRAYRPFADDHRLPFQIGPPGLA